MKRTKPLSETNPYLKDPETRKKAIRRSVITSSGVEGIKVKKAAAKVAIPRRKKNAS